MDQEAQDAMLIVHLSEAFNKDEVWQLAAAEAWSKATNLERVLIRGSTEAKQLKLVDVLIRKTSAAGLGAGSAAGAGAAAGPGPGSTAADGGAWMRLEFEKLAISSLNKIQATLTNLQLSVPIVTVTPSSCSSTQCKRIEEAVSVRFNYVTAAQAPCCCPFAKPWSPEEPSRFSWGRADVVVLPVQAIEWLAGGVLCGDINIVIKTSKTSKMDYIFVPEAAWKDCQERFGAELFEGYKLRVTSGTMTSALLSMLDSVIALYEAKTEKALKDSLPSVRAQALLEYLAINQMKDWPTDDVIVLFGDLNQHFVVHAGRKDADMPKRSIHVAGPAPLPAVLEESPSTVADRSPLSSTLGFIRALLETSRTEEASSTGGGLGRGATRNDEGGSGSCRQGTTNSRREGAHGSGGAASGSGGRGAGSDSGHSDAADAADNWAGAGSGRRHGRSGSSSADSSGSSVGGESFDGDEGILEAARDNVSAQAFMSLLRLPEVYEPLGFKEPPKSFRPPTKEELLARFRPFEVIHTAALPQPLPHALLVVTRCSPAAQGITKPHCPAVASFHHRWGGHEQQGLGTIELGHWVWRDSGGVGLSLDRAQRDGKMAGSWTFRDCRSIENVLIGLQTAELQEPPITGSVSELSEVKSMSSAPAALSTARTQFARGLRRAYSNAVPSGMAMGGPAASSSTSGGIGTSKPQAWAPPNGILKINPALLQAGGLDVSREGPQARASFEGHLSSLFLPVNLDHPGLRVLNIDPPVITVEGFLSAPECDGIVRSAADSGLMKQSGVGVSGYQVKDTENVRTSSTLAATAEPGQTAFELPQVARYQPGQHFLTHEDAFPAAVVGSKGYQRRATLLVYLNDCEQGGATKFDILDIAVQPRKGTALLFFPAFANGMPDRRTLHTAQDAVSEKWVTQLWLSCGVRTSVQQQSGGPGGVPGFVRGTRGTGGGAPPVPKGRKRGVPPQRINTKI
ncbi:hypothetical protein VOLCADRAFT_107241 [Volvox carteri f. nagariensis]|uniref:Fe2OG dioxygenase domain-containing protein n=1 Tax=Volvox carteri f. nagariensis TaxID=3068 RepID=D8UCT7_VOLCA|nr:uncharacterized protein VOLCADRAFT_107241 [Volvox carteri f. nagariensis]EFJ42400.1 hypothetical protein VOLCADRAFT_107241 [Volvox carteri f. nagariensis]|eukprot:XP_002956463.1 hypothetical protein VOLCADRAFT_107241 [Volvox carteri f. nagariensis]